MSLPSKRNSVESRVSIPIPSNYTPPSKELQNKSFVELFEMHAEASPNKTAIHLENDAYTYGQINHLANQIAHTLLQLDVNPKRGVSLLLGKNPQMAAALVGALKSAKRFVTLDPSFPTELLKFMVEDSKSMSIVTDEKNIKLAKQLAPGKIKIVNIDDIPSSQEEGNPALEISPDTISHLLYTSGSTGKPKGTILTHGILRDSLMQTTVERYYSSEERYSMLGSFGFSGSLHKCLYMLMSGASIHLYDINNRGFEPLAGWINQQGITFMLMLPTVFRHFCKTLPTDVRFPTVRLLRLAGETILKFDVELYKTFFSAQSRLQVGLAGTEAGLLTEDLFDIHTEIKSAIVPTGYPVTGAEIFIWDKDGNEIPPGETGEIVVKSPGVTPGYWRRPELTQSKFLPDPDGSDLLMYKTGDLGRFLPDGRLVHVGRIDGMVKIRGFRVEIGAIENTLLQEQTIDHALVTIIDNHMGDKQIVAYIVPVDKEDLIISDIRMALAEKLPDYMMPARFVIIDKFPTTPTGKVDRNSLPIPDRSRPVLDNEFVEPKNKVERDLTDVWQTILDLEQVGIYDNFFDLGGDSLMAAQLFVEIEKVFKKKLPLSILYTASNIRQQAKILRQDDLKIDWSPLVSVQIKGAKPPLFCFPGMGGNPIRFRHLSQHLGKDQPVYMLQARGLSGQVSPFKRVEDISADFLKAIQEVVPDGPYSLVGNSGGGHVAFEIAQQLLAQGKQIKLLAFVDTYGPGYPKYISSKTTGRNRVFRVLQYFGKHAANLRVVSWRGKISYIKHYIKESWRRIKGAPALSAQETENVAAIQIPQELVAVQKANMKAIRYYKPQPYPGQVILFRASEQPWGIHPDPTLGWGEVGIQDLVIREVPGHHGSILYEPRVGKLAEILVKALK